MSVKVMTWVFESSEESVAGRRLVLLVLADKADHDGTGAYPSVATIARESRMSERGVRYALRALEESGRIERRGLHPQYGTTEYAVIMRAEVQGGHRVPGGNETQAGGQSDAESVSQIAPEPSIEPSKEPSSGERARARTQQLPDDFPEELKPHARDVFRVLRSVAEQHGAREVTPRAVGHAIMGAPGRHYVEEAHAVASWAQAPPRPIRDVVGTYRTWLQRAQAYAGVENLGTPIAASAPTNVHTMRPRGRRSTPADFLALRGTLG